MLFEWDEAKSDHCLALRGFDFEFTSLVFSGPVLEAADTRFDYRENRVCAIGEAEEFILFVVYTDRGEVRRIISARPANRKERRLWRLFARP